MDIMLSASTQNELTPQFSNIIEKIWSHKKFIFLSVSVVVTSAIIFSLILPLRFTSSATVLPETEKGKLSGLSDLANLAGLNVGGTETSLLKLYPAIIKSESILKKVIYSRYFSFIKKDSLDLIHIWDIEGNTEEERYESAYKSLSDRLDVSLDIKTGLLTLKLEDCEPQLTADILNRTIQELDYFIRKKKNTSASAQRQFIETRLYQVKHDLAEAENTLKMFREKNRSIASPSLVLDQERLIREVTVNNTLYVELKKQYELSKIEEVKNIPIINVLDKAKPAVRKSYPKRGVIVIVSAIFAILGSIGYVFMKEMILKYVVIVRSIIKKH